MDNFFKRHNAECSNCDHALPSSDSGSFIDHFFLPSMCAGCGAVMSRDRIKTHWVHVTKTYKRIPPVRTRNPLTWLRCSRWEVSETIKYAV